MSDLNAMLEPGMFVRHPDRPDWGLGQVQANINGRMTVNFENEGKDFLPKEAEERVEKDLRLLDLYVWGSHEVGSPPTRLTFLQPPIRSCRIAFANCLGEYSCPESNH